jgi:hypothetical protein
LGVGGNVLPRLERNQRENEVENGFASAESDYLRRGGAVCFFGNKIFFKKSAEIVRY